MPQHMEKDRRLPLVVAVTGHRDLVPSEVEGIRAKIDGFLKMLLAEFPDRRIQLMSPLAEGADRLAAQSALASGVELIVPMPMARESYRTDFADGASRAAFEELCLQASRVFELPEGGQDRDSLYAQLGIFLSSHCHILLAVWDGKSGESLGGTAQVVGFHHDNIMPGYAPATVTTQQMLVDDENDLVYHIVCSREREDGGPADGLSALDAAWFTKDITAPRSSEMPDQHRRIFRRSNEFSRDCVRFSAHIDEHGWSLFEKTSPSDLPHGMVTIDSLFQAADWMAIHYQRRTIRVLRVSHVLAFAMGFLFIVYSDFANEGYLMYAFLGCFGLATVVQWLAGRRGWQRKYLDYRALAEGLRVQFYWAAAGVVSSSASRFTHDDFLQSQDAELGWIRNVMRVAGMSCDADTVQSADGLQFVERHWIGRAEGGGQLAYFLRRLDERTKRHRLTRFLGHLSLAASAAVVVIFVLGGSSVSEALSNWLLLAMGTLLLAFGVRHAYAYSTAENELIRQFEFMSRIYANGRRRLNRAGSDDERRQVLRALGKSALSEHSQWLLMHRERSVDQAEIWRMGSGS